MSTSLNDKRSQQNQDRILRSNEVIALTGLSRTTLWRQEREGNFPSRRRISIVAVGWLKSEVDSWIEERQAITLDNKLVTPVTRRGRKPKSTISQH